MARELLEGGLMAAAFALLALPAITGGRRRWVAAVAILGFLYATLLFLPLAWPPARAYNGNWNELGKALTLSMTTVAAVVLIRSGSFTRGDFGLTFAQAIGTRRAVLRAIVPFLLLVAGLVWFLSPAGPLPDHEQLAFEATLPGLDEEFFFRGVVLALFDRMFPPRWNLFGAHVGYGVIATSLVFGLFHAVGIGPHLHVSFYPVPGLLAAAVGLVLAWIRLRTRSLVWPVLTHNAVNLLNDLVPVLH